MKTAIFTVSVILLAVPLFSDLSVAQVYEYRNAAGRLVQSGSPPPGYSGSERRSPGRFKFIKSKEKTAEDIPLDFDVEKTEYEYGYFKIWGSVKGSKKNRSYKWVQVTFSLYGGRGGDLIARESTFADPKDIGPGQVGYIIGYPIECNISKLNVVEYKVTGK